jgi:outer membrane protein
LLKKQKIKEEKMKRLFVLIFSVLCLSLGMQAKDNSVAYVDMAYILKNLPQYETANEQLTMIAKRWQKEVDALEQEIRVMTTNYQTEQIFLSEAMRKQREQEILDKEKQAQELKRKYFGEAGELNKKREALLKPIQDEIYTAIQEIAMQKGYQVVKDRSSEPSLIYMSNKLDISDQVLNKLGAK